MTKRAMTAGMLAVVLSLVAGGAYAAEASISLDVASAYVWRGITLNDGPVLQPGLEVSGIPVTLGVWGNVDLSDYDGTLEEGWFSEVDLYASYDIPIPGETFGMTLGYTEYLYAYAGGDADREANLTAALDVIAAPWLTAYYGFHGPMEKNLYVEGGVGHEMTFAEKVGLDLGATVAYFSPNEGNSGLSHWTATAGLSYWLLSASVTYVGRIDSDVLPDGQYRYDTDVYGMIGVAYDY